MGLWKSKATWTASKLVKQFRSREHSFPETVGIFTRSPDPTLVERIMLQRFAKVAYREATELAGHDALSPTSQEALERVVRDADLMLQVLSREKLLGSVYQMEEVHAIAVRIARSYGEAADGMVAAVP
jgi:hypothetical protein